MCVTKRVNSGYEQHLLFLCEVILCIRRARLTSTIRGNTFVVNQVPYLEHFMNNDRINAESDETIYFRRTFRFAGLKKLFWPSTLSKRVEQMFSVR